MEVAVCTWTVSAGPGLVDQLRLETRNLHEGLEQDLDWRRRMATVDGYRGLLTRWWGFHADFEPIVDARPPLRGLEPRRKLHLLEQDLSHLEMSAATIRALPRIGSLAFLNDRAGMIGAMYVLEGSTLGGQLIAQYVRSVLAGTLADGACAYYEAYGHKRAGPMWRAFLDRLSADVPPASHADVIAGARRTFVALRAWLPHGSASGVGSSQVLFR